MLDIVIHKFAEWNGNDIFILREDLLPYACGGNKVRIAMKLIADAKEKGADIVVGYGNSRSNLCRVLAMLCAKEKLGCVIISPSDDDGMRTETMNGKIVKLLGAEVVCCEKSAMISDVVKATMERLCVDGHRPYYIFGDEYGHGNEQVLMSAYEDVAEQILAWQKSHGVCFDKISLAVGTGSTYAGLLDGLRSHGDNTSVLGFTVAREKTRCKLEIGRFLECGQMSWGSNDIVVSDIALAGGYGKATSEEIMFLKDVAADYSILFDSTYSGKALWGLAKSIGYCKRREAILFVHTGSLPLSFDFIRSL